jgi:hypothetical protein
VEVARSMATDRAALGSLFSGTGELCTVAAVLPCLVAAARRGQRGGGSLRPTGVARVRHGEAAVAEVPQRGDCGAAAVAGVGPGLTAELPPATQMLTLVAAHGGQLTEELLALRAVIQTSAIAAAPLCNASQDTAGHWVPPEQWARMPPELRAAVSIVGERQRRSRRRGHGGGGRSSSPCSPPPRRHRGSRGNEDAASPETERQRPRPGREELRPRPPAVLVEAITTVR